MLHTHRIEVKTEREDLKQKKLTDVFFSKEKNNFTPHHSVNKTNSQDERFILGRRIVLWLCKDLLPFKSIENKGFKDFWASLRFDLSLPTRQTVSISALDDIYKCLKNELITKLSNENIGKSLFSFLKYLFFNGNFETIYVNFFFFFPKIIQPFRSTRILISTDTDHSIHTLIILLMTIGV